MFLAPYRTDEGEPRKQKSLIANSTFTGRGRKNRSMNERYTATLPLHGPKYGIFLNALVIPFPGTWWIQVAWRGFKITG